jgi:hypothetical protein
MAGLIFSFFFEIFLIIGLISSSSRSSVKTMIFLLSSTQWFFSLSTISLEFIEDLSWNKSKNVWCNVWRLDNMHASLLGLKYRSPPSLTLLCLLFEAFLVFLCHLIRVPAIHSILNVVSIVGCPRWLLLSLLTKHDRAPQVWCCLIHHEWA